MTAKKLPIYLSLDEAAEIMSLSTKTIKRRIATAPSPPTNAANTPSESASTTSKRRLRRFPSARW